MNTWKGAPWAICAYRLPDDPSTSLTRWPEAFSNSGTSSSSANFKSEAAATVTMLPLDSLPSLAEAGWAWTAATVSTQPSTMTSQLRNHRKRTAWAEQPAVRPVITEFTLKRGMGIQMDSRLGFTAAWAQLSLVWPLAVCVAASAASRARSKTSSRPHTPASSRKRQTPPNPVPEACPHPRCRPTGLPG